MWIQIRVYYITPSSTLGELAFINGAWAGGVDLKIKVLPDSALLYASKPGNVLIVGYTNTAGNLSEAFYDRGGSGVWQTYDL